MDQNEFKVAIGILDDCRRLIAAGKVQRWDVLKWGVSVNIALAAATLSPALADISLKLKVLVIFISAIIAVLSSGLILHYNTRMTRARRQAGRVISWLKKGGISYDTILGEDTKLAYSAGHAYDHQELWYFLITLVVSTALVAFTVYMSQK